MAVAAASGEEMAVAAAAGGEKVDAAAGVAKNVVGVVVSMAEEEAGRRRGQDGTYCRQLKRMTAR